MGTAPPHPCARCGAYISGRCPRCARKQDRARGTAHARGYTAEWAEFSRAWLQRHPWCGERADGRLYAEHSWCVRAERRTRATVTDHIRALKDGGAHMVDSNHQSLCADCNRRKAIKFEGALAR